MAVWTVIIIPILLELSPSVTRELITELWIESENDIITETETDNKVTEIDNNLIENVQE
jgi:hypothetical protein